MKNCKQKLEILWCHFDKVSLLSDRNGDEVWRVRHQTTKQDFILRILQKQSAVYESLLTLRSKNLPIVYEVYPCDDGMIVLEEYIDGITISQVAQTGHYRKRGAIEVIGALCNALALLHQNGIIHRDIKPENVMISNDGRVCLIDFNAARHMKPQGRDTVIMGTVGFAPPEQLGLASSDERTDVYALGVLLNLMLTGKYPSEQIAKGYLGRVIRKCTNVNPADRYSSVQKLYQALYFL